MFKLLERLINLPVVNSLIGRLVNRYTGSGIVIVLMQLEALEILPQGVTQVVDGLPSKELIVYVGLGVGIYLIMHKPKLKSKLDRLKEEIEIEKAKQELIRYRNKDGNK